MQRDPVKSSTLRAVGYDPEKKILEVEFNNGGVYQYFGVDKDIYDRLSAAQSAGKFFSSEIRGKYSTAKA
jgi:hypothetical protein